MPHEFDGQIVSGDYCNRCDKTVEWFHIMDSLADACKECGFVRIDTLGRGQDGTKKYEAGATIQE